MAQTSDRISGIAARMGRLTPAAVRATAENPAALNAFVQDARSMAASLLRQDEVRGLRKVLLKLAMAGVPPREASAARPTPPTGAR